jgi:hypothetical protein
MRTVLFALLSFLVLAPQAADAARQNDRTTQAGRAQSAQTVTRAAPRAATRAAPRASARRGQAAPPRAAAIARSGRPTARAARSGARNSQVAVRRGDVRAQRRGTVVRGAAAATISRSVGDRNLGWQAGLPAMTMEQRDCPIGTFATLARGHDDVIRCMPL